MKTLTLIFIALLTLATSSSLTAGTLFSKHQASIDFSDEETGPEGGGDGEGGGGEKD